MPRAHFSRLIDALGGQYDLELDLYIVDCDSVQKLDDITYELSPLTDESRFNSRYTFNVSSNDYVIQMASSPA